jgi:asparagine synthase (glutamine-hydrolysing)
VCGIAGFVRGALAPRAGADDSTLGADARAARRGADHALGADMARRLHHRGPDASGVALLPRGRGAFAHARLAIIDLSPRGAQPYVSVDGAVTLAFNGEIYGYRALRADLERRGVVFRSSSDTEVILELYRTYGVDALDALDGMFAFALFDAAADRVVLARDRLGKKPLWYAELPGGDLVFGSEAKALFAHPEVPRAIDARHVPEYLSFGYVGTPRSLFAGLAKLEPATRRVYRPGRAPSTTRYWSLDAVRPVEPPSFEAACTRVRELVGEAVERRLVADVPVGAFLSGGIDSAVVTYEMVQRSAGRVRTFTAGFRDDASFDERDQAAALAARLGTDHTALEVEAVGPDQFERLLEHHDEPYGDSSAIAQYAVAAATKRHVSVVLTGDGGDEVLAGYSRFLGGLVVGRAPVPALALARRVLARVPEPRGYKSPLALARRFVEHAERSEDEQLLAWNAYFAGPALAALVRRDVLGDVDPWAVLAPQAAILARWRAAGRDRLDQILRHNLETYLLDDLLVIADRMTMAVGLEARSPFLDAALVELCFTIPSRHKLRRGRLKAVLREAYRGRLPDEVLDRKKHGFGVPVSRWWGAALRGPLEDWLGGPSARVHAYLEPAEVRRVLDAHFAGTRDHGQRIFALLQLELWLRRLERPA